MKKLTVGILAHVDAGKTTLSEGLLYLCGCIRRVGRVDHRDTFFDTYELERARGITIFSKQALLSTRGTEIWLLDTPGHTDFSAEAERVLSVLDYAILVISAPEGVQLHTETLWRLLRRRDIPTFIFINKTDIAGFDRAVLMEELHRTLSENCVDFDLRDCDRGMFDEQAAMCSEILTETYLENGKLSDNQLTEAIARREIFPCCFGSALRMEGVSHFLSTLEEFTKEPLRGEEFSARVYKIGRDSQGARLVYAKITGGTLRVKQQLSAGEPEDGWTEKVDQIRLYSGEKFKVTDSVSAGDLCALTGLSRVQAGEGLGAEKGTSRPLLEPVLEYRLLLPPEISAVDAYRKLQILGAEDPQLHLHWDEDSREIRVSMMGLMQMEVLSRQMEELIGCSVQFDRGSIVYRETVSAPVEGAGHFEPLRHYAEVHLLLEPGEPGSGVTFASAVPENSLSGSWQRLILSQLSENLPCGVLTGSVVTDIRVTLTGGRASLKHTVGGDFLQAAFRAFRQALMKAKEAGNVVLLEPWYSYRIVLPDQYAGRALTDLERMSATVRSPEQENGVTVLTGCVPCSEIQEYPIQLQTYTKGAGTLNITFHGYAPCHNQTTVETQTLYIADHDLRYPADSIFCHAGAGVIVPWQEADSSMHTESVLSNKQDRADRLQRGRYESLSTHRPQTYQDVVEEDRELKAIFERTYGPVSRRSIFVPPPPVTVKEARKTYLSQMNPEYDFLLVDGYNIVFSWEELTAIARDSLDLARQTLIHIMANYQGVRGCNLILVFDAYRVTGGIGSVERYGGIYVIYTRAKETADTYIEKVTYDIGKEHRVRVATSDAMEQVIVMGHGAERLSAMNLRDEVMTAGEELQAQMEKINQENR